MSMGATGRAESGHAIDCLKIERTLLPFVVRDVLRGLGDTFENLLPFTIISLGWWLSVVLVIPAAGSTIALFAATDPRAVHSTRRPGIREGLHLTEYFLARGWMLFLLAAPLLGVATFNLWTYRNDDSVFTALIPLWIALLVVVAAVTAVTLSCIALFDDGISTGVRRAGSIVVRQTLPAVLILAALWGLLLISTVLVVPLFLFFPALAGSVVNRFVLRALGIAIPDPLEPSEERRIEEERARSA